jgi:hypothetical protein
MKKTLVALAMLTFAAPVHAQAPLPAGWERTTVREPPLFQTTALACSADRAFVRDYEGNVRVFDGTRWSALPGATDADGGRLWASPRGRLAMDAQRRVLVWDGTAWSEVPLDPWLASGPGLAAIAGLGESPWVLGRGAIGIDVPTDEGPLLRAHDVANAWYALNDLAVLAYDRVYVASAAGLLRWDGRAWSIEETGIAEAVGGVRAFARNDVWVWNDMGVAHFDGTRWTARQEGLELPGPTLGRFGRDVTETRIGGRPGAVYLTTPDRVYRLDGQRWVAELDATHRHPIGNGYREVCATDRFVIVSEGGYALVRR